jgi:hypothetical protein
LSIVDCRLPIAITLKSCRAAFCKLTLSIRLVVGNFLLEIYFKKYNAKLT